MSDTLITVIAIFIAAIVMFVFPVMYVAKSNEQISQTNVQALTNDFVNNARTTGKITEENYSAFQQQLNATGNTFDIEVELQVLDENPRKVNSTTIGENLYYSKFTNDIENQLREQGFVDLKEGDVITVTVKNTNKTLFQIFMTVIMGTNNNTSSMEATVTAVITSNN